MSSNPPDDAVCPRCAAGIVLHFAPESREEIEATVKAPVADVLRIDCPCGYSALLRDFILPGACLAPREWEVTLLCRGRDIHRARWCVLKRDRAKVIVPQEDMTVTPDYVFAFGRLWVIVGCFATPTLQCEVGLAAFQEDPSVTGHSYTTPALPLLPPDAGVWRVVEDPSPHNRPQPPERSIAMPVQSSVINTQGYATDPATALMCSSSLFPCSSFFLVWDRLRNVVYPPEDAAREAQNAHREWFDYPEMQEYAVVQGCISDSPPVFTASSTRCLLALFANGYSCMLRNRFKAVENVSVEKRYAKNPSS